MYLNELSHSIDLSSRLPFSHRWQGIENGIGNAHSTAAHGELGSAGICGLPHYQSSRGSVVKD